MKYLWILGFAVVLSSSCKRDQPSAVADVPVENEEESTSTSSSADFGRKDITEMTDEEMLEFEANVKSLKQPIEGDIKSFFTTEMWEFSGGMSPGKAFDYGRGEWYQFSEDMTFEHGLFGETLTSGKWEMDEKSATIRLIPDQATGRNSEWKYSTKLNSLVLSGTGTYGDQSTQFKLARTNTKPSQLGFN